MKIKKLTSRSKRKRELSIILFILLLFIALVVIVLLFGENFTPEGEVSHILSTPE